VEERGWSPPPRGTTGPYYFAINYPERRDLAVVLKRLLGKGRCIDGAYEAIYLHDLDYNGIELACYRDRSEWPRRGNDLTLTKRPLDFEGLISELGNRFRFSLHLTPRLAEPPELGVLLRDQNSKGAQGRVYEGEERGDEAGVVEDPRGDGGDNRAWYRRG
jgi:hypothetical protein